MEFTVDVTLKDSAILSEQRQKTLAAYKLLASAIANDGINPVDGTLAEATSFLNEAAELGKAKESKDEHKEETKEENQEKDVD